MAAFAQHFSFEFRTGLRNRTLLFLTYLFPLGFFVMMGLLMCNINPLFRGTMIPAMVVFAAITGAFLGLPGPLVEAREAGIFRSFRVNGVPALSILVIPALSTGVHIVITAAIMTAAGWPLFQAPLPVDWLSFALVVLVTAFTCSGLGALIGVISTNSRVTMLWSQLLYLPSMMLSGMMVPLSMLPSGLARVAELLPATHAMRALLGLAYRQPTDYDPMWSVLILLAGGVLAFAMAILLFNWDSRNTTGRLHPVTAALAMLPYAMAALLLG